VRKYYLLEDGDGSGWFRGYITFDPEELNYLINAGCSFIGSYSSKRGAIRAWRQWRPEWKDNIVL